MKPEITIAADFLVSLVKAQRRALVRHHQQVQVDEMKLHMFKCAITTLLTTRYQQHWFPECPSKGSAYRCIRINGKMDPLIAQAGAAVGLDVSSLRCLLPTELTMWIDPREVSYRIGENGSISVCEFDFAYTVLPAPPQCQPPPSQSPDVFFDPRYEDIDPMVDYVV